MQEAAKLIQPSSRREGFSAIPNVKWEDVGGLDSLRHDFDRYIVRRIKNPKDYMVSNSLKLCQTFRYKYCTGLSADWLDNFHLRAPYMMPFSFPSISCWVHLFTCLFRPSSFFGHLSFSLAKFMLVSYSIAEDL